MPEPQLQLQKVKVSRYRAEQALAYGFRIFHDVQRYEGVKVATLRHRPPLPPGVSSCSFLEAESTPEHMVPSVDTEKIPSDTTGDGSRDPQTGSAVP